MAQDRETLQRLAEVRLSEAQHLVSNGHYAGAYYLAGFAIECGLKAKIAAQFRADEIPDRTLVNSVYKHDLSELLSLANLKEQHAEAMTGTPELRRSWAVVTKWKPEARYRLWAYEEAASMLEAVEGLMRWLRNHW